MFVAEEKNGELYAIPAAEVKKFPNSALAVKILALLAKEDLYPKEISRRLKENEQKIYYHIRRMEKGGIVEVASREERTGGMAKIYMLKSPAFFMRFSDFVPAARIPKTSRWLEPFVVNGRLNARIIVGSPDPHGPEKARSRDAYYAVDLGLFLGTFLTESIPSVMLDTDSLNLKENLILIGGPVINRVTRMANKSMPIRFDERKNIYSSLTRKTYRSDDCGLIVKMKNPFDTKKDMLVIAGKRYTGTKAAILAFLKNFGKIERKNAHVVDGIDSDGDGVVDDVKIVE